jgi:hypothetical protein
VQDDRDGQGHPRRPARRHGGGGRSRALALEEADGGSLPTPCCLVMARADLSRIVWKTCRLGVSSCCLVRACDAPFVDNW